MRQEFNPESCINYISPAKCIAVLRISAECPVIPSAGDNFDSNDIGDCNLSDETPKCTRQYPLDTKSVTLQIIRTSLLSGDLQNKLISGTYDSTRDAI